jgi:hypothetical protein
MEEKRKRMGEEDGMSKRPNTRSGRKDEPIRPVAQKEVGEMSTNPIGTPQPVQMEVDNSAKKGKEHTARRSILCRLSSTRKESSRSTPNMDG